MEAIFRSAPPAEIRVLFFKARPGFLIFSNIIKCENNYKSFRKIYIIYIFLMQERPS